MAPPEPEGNWGRIDRTNDPNHFVNYLDQVSAQDAIQQIKQQTFDLLEPHQGAQYLDVGCGVGDDVRALAQFVGASGRVVGVDNSATMIAEAKKRSEGTNLPVEFRVGDTYRLDFPDNSFDGCRADRVLQHLQEPRRALAELIRVVNPNAPIVVTDPDWETLIVDASDRAVTRKVLNAGVDARVNGWSGRQLVGLFKSLGLKEIGASGRTLIVADYALASQLASLDHAAQRAVEDGSISTQQAEEWLADLQARAQAGTFFSAMVGFIVSGRK